jgi:stress-induced morphogen
MVKQHRLVTDSLKNEIAEMHGIRINTVAPQSDDP